MITRLDSGGVIGHPLKHTWPRYLPPTSQRNFFAPFSEEIIKILRNLPILESWDGSMHIPTSLIYVPEEFLDDCKRPLTLSPETETQYVSDKYIIRDQILALGVKKMTIESFLAQLKQLVGDASHLQDKPSEWHSRLAEVLSRLAAERKHRWVVSRLAVVPVHSHEGRKWVSAKTQDVYFSRGTSG